MHQSVSHRVFLSFVTILILLTGCGETAVSTKPAVLTASPQPSGSAPTSTSVANPINTMIGPTETTRASLTPTPTFALMSALSPITNSDVNKLELLNILTNDYSDAVYNVAFSPDGKFLASSGANSTLIVWDLGTGKPALKLEDADNVGGDVAFSPDNAMFASGSTSSGKVSRVWNLPSGKQILTIPGHGDNVVSLTFSPDNSLLASGSVNYDSSGTNVLAVWNFKTGSQQIWNGHTSSVTSVAFSPDGELLASGSQDTTILLQDTKTSQTVAVLKGHTGTVNSIAFSPDGTLLASSGGDYTDKVDNTVRLWNATTHQAISVLHGHTASVNSVAFSPDGSLLASGSNDHTMRFWDSSTGELLKVLSQPAQVRDIAINAQGTLLASASVDGTICLWGVPVP